MEEIELREYFYILWKRKWIIVLIILLSIITSGILSYYVLTPEYETFTTLMLGKPNISREENIEYNDVLLNQKLVSTYGEIAKSKLVSKEVIKNLDLDITSSALAEKINVSLVRDTGIIKILVNDYEPQFAANIANETAAVFMKHVVDLMKIENVQVIDRAEVPTVPVRPRSELNMAIAGILGLMISIFIIFLLEYMDNTIKTPDEIERYLGLSVIGVIPKRD